jgi:type IV pilus assembly protein PilV
MNMNVERATGFSMVEVLVSIVILSIALLGTAGLVGSSLRSTNTSYYRSQATVLADDILDRMRANRTSARNGEYNIDLGPAYAAPSGSLAEYDTHEWTDTLASTLPDGQGTVSVAGGVVIVTIQWDEAVSNSFTTQSLL